MPGVMVPMAGRILLVEDDQELGRQVRTHLERKGYAVTWLSNGDDALHEDPSTYSLLVLDLMLPGAYGLDILKAARKQTEVPVLILSARNETQDKVRALELGADDYVTKPFWPEELVARIEARLRRPALHRKSVVRFGLLRVEMAARRLLRGEVEVALAPMEFDVLAALARRIGEAVPRMTLVEQVLGFDATSPLRTLDVHVSRLRKKLGDDAAHVATVYKIGYRLDAELLQ